MRYLSGEFCYHRKENFVNQGLLERGFEYVSDGLSYPSDWVKSAPRKGSPLLPHLAAVAQAQGQVLIFLERQVKIVEVLG